MDLINTFWPVLVVIMGGVCAMVLVSTKTLRDSRDDFAVRIKQLEDERVLDKEKIASQATEIQIWRKAVTGEAQLTAISVLLNEHHGEARKNWILVNAGLSHLGTAIDHMNDSLDRIAERGGDA